MALPIVMCMQPPAVWLLPLQLGRAHNFRRSGGHGLSGRSSPRFLRRLTHVHVDSAWGLAAFTSCVSENNISNVFPHAGSPIRGSLTKLARGYVSTVVAVLPIFFHCRTWGLWMVAPFASCFSACTVYASPIVPARVLSSVEAEAHIRVLSLS